MHDNGLIDNIFVILADSAYDIDEVRPHDKREKTTQSFQLSLADKKKLDDICRHNCSTASAFLRACCENLIKGFYGSL